MLYCNVLKEVTCGNYGSLELTENEKKELVNMLNEQDKQHLIIKQLGPILQKCNVWNDTSKMEILKTIYESWRNSRYFKMEEWDENNLPPYVVETNDMLCDKIKTLSQYLVSYTGSTYIENAVATPVEPDSFGDIIYYWIRAMVDEYYWKMCTIDYGMDEVETAKLFNAPEFRRILNTLSNEILDEIIATYSNFNYMEIGIEALQN